MTGPFTVEAVPAPSRVEVGWTNIAGGQKRAGMPADLQLDHPSPAPARRCARPSGATSCSRPASAARAGSRSDFVALEPLPGTRWLTPIGETKEDKPQRGGRLLRAGARAAGAAAGGAGHRGGADARAEAEARRLRRLPVRPRGREGHRRDQLARRDAAQGADERRPADRGPEEEARQQRELLAHRPAGRGAARDRQGRATRASIEVEVHGFDYYNTKTGKIESGGKDKIAMWLLDTDYDGRSLFPRQVFFPMAGEKDGWARLAKNLKAEIDEELIEHTAARYRCRSRRASTAASR